MERWELLKRLNELLDLVTAVLEGAHEREEPETLLDGVAIEGVLHKSLLYVINLDLVRVEVENAFDEIEEHEVEALEDQLEVV